MGVDIETYRGRIGTFKFAFGTDVVTVECLIKFSQAIKTVGSVAFIGLLLVMAGIESNPGPKGDDEAEQMQSGSVIEVTGIPSDVDEAYLTLVFKNPKKQGGGKVKTVQLNRETNSAFIEFEDPDAAEKVLSKRPITIAGTVVGVTAVTKATSCTIEVRGFKMIGSTEEYLELYFEDEESSGGDTVEEIKMLGEGRALVTFKSAKVAKRVVERGNHILSQELTVTHYSERKSPDSNITPPRQLVEDDSVLSGMASDVPQIEMKQTEAVAYGQLPSKSMESEPISTTQITLVLPLNETLPEHPSTSTGAVSTEILQTKSEPDEHVSTESLPVKQEEPVLNKTERVVIEQTRTELIDAEPMYKIQLTTEQVETTSNTTKPVIIRQLPSELLPVQQNSTEQISNGQQYTDQKCTEHEFGENVLTETEPYERLSVIPESTVLSPTELVVAQQQITGQKSTTFESSDTTSNEAILDESFRTESLPTVLISGRKKSEQITEHDELNEINESEQFKTDRNEEVLDTTEEHDSDSLTIHQMLETLGLVDRYPEKIKVEDILAIPMTENKKNADKFDEVPRILLKQILAVQSQARDTCLSGLENADKLEGDDEFDFIDETSASNELSPLDVFNITVQCCDSMLKQLLYKKLYLCKIALPFVHIDRLSLESKISVWPFRSLVVSSISVNQKEPKEIELLELPVKTVTFARLSRTQLSKSKLISNLISDQIHDTFYNWECPSGLTHRCFSNGTIEMFCLPSVGNKNDSFSEAITFFNMRGNIESDFKNNVITLISEMSDTLVIIMDKVYLEKKASSLKKVISHFPSAVLVIDSPLNSNDRIKFKTFKDNSEIPLIAIGSHKGSEKKNLKEIVANIKSAISSSIKTSVSQSVESRLKSVKSALHVDENAKECIEGKMIASTIFQQMSELEDKYKWKEIVTPVNHVYTPKLSVSVKRLYRLQNVDEIGSVEDEINSVRKRQLENVTEPMKTFINSVTDNIRNASKLQYIFGWLSFFLERQKRLLLPKLIEENLSCWKNLGNIKKKGILHSDPEMKRQIQLTEASQKRIEDASLGIEHLLREIGHVYEALMALDKSQHPTDMDLPSVSTVIDTVATLVVQGQPFELVDGDNFFMPTRWVHEVLEKVSSKIKQKRVMAISVLGLQSSGKSTLLNAMFGSQFPVKSGRCTRGIHIQLLPCTSNASVHAPFEFILVVDTEGLRAPELNPNRSNHDNELSTVVTGLGDATLLNIMGENTSEIRDIVQVVVHAFLRLKLVKKTTDIDKSFYLLHQNVVDISASDNMRTGLQVLIETLDTVTKDAAETEGITDITTFNQVIEFDLSSNVWYLPNYWQGNPPMARVNSGYSDRLADEKSKLLNAEFSRKDKAYQTLKDVAIHIQDLWKGVLTEDFVFSFRNSLEIKAYVQLEETLKEALISLENDVDDKRINYSQAEFSKCENQDQLQNAFDEIILQTQKFLVEKESVAKEVMVEFFENNEYKDTIIQWKEFTYNRIRLHCSELEDSMKLETLRLREKKSIYIMTVEDSKEHEKKLYDRSLRVARETKGTNLTEEEVDMKFEETWKNIMREIMNVGISSNKQTSVRDFIIKFLFDVIFSTEKMILKTELEAKGIFQLETETHATADFTVLPVSHLKGSFCYTSIFIEDISFSKDSPDSDQLKLALVEEKIDYLFETLDLYIARCCQGNMEMTQREVKNSLLKTQKEMELIRKGNKEFTLKITAVVKLFIHVGSFIQTKFDEHNINYQKSQGVQARLESYKLQVKEHFIAYIKDRKAEETAAKQICLIMENNLREKIKERLPVTIKAALLNSITNLKFHLMLEMLQDMTDKDDFNSFIDYIQHPKLFAEKWITQMSKEFLFGPESKKYYELASGAVSEFYNDLKEIASASAQAFRFESPSMESWLKCFTTKFSRYTLPESSFYDIYKILDKIEDMNNFECLLLEQICVSEANLKSEFEEQTYESVTWSGENPYELLINKAWGCPEQCAFCGEPCAKDNNHEGTNHYSLQHRLSCCKGVRNENTNKACITSCNYDIQSDETHHCNVFDFLCNAPKRTACETVWHKYRDYRKYLPNWDIEPNSNMQDCGKFWLWFVAKYKQKLAARYNYVVSNVPSAWNAITKVEALENLRRLYMGSS